MIETNLKAKIPTEFDSEGFFYCPYIPDIKNITIDDIKFEPKTGYKARMTDVRKEPFITNDVLTIHKLKEILSVLPDTDENGEDYEVWIGDKNSFTSSPVTSVWSLNKTENGCDIILEA